MQIPELLAPAGSIETFRAAFDAGADAIYLGCGDFNARKRAKNFTEDELRLAVEYAHSHRRRIYITLNTLVFDHEIDALIELLELIREIRADAVIVQDWGVISILRKHFPEIPLHASTQMFCHNSLHADFLRRQGISRIILPRELSLEEIGAMMQRVPLEYEVFVHGAMCISFSGCCMASSRLYRESGNRGQCHQVCRFPFREKGEVRYPFSMKDLNALGLVNELVRLGVSSLKIEGRLKNAAYVAETVSAWRSALDAVRDGRPLPVHRLSRQRVTESGYFRGGADYSRLVWKDSSGTAGEVFGYAVSLSGREIRINTLLKPVRGMRLRIQDVRGKNLFEGTLLDFRSEREILVWTIPEAVRISGVVSPFTVYLTGMSAPGDVTGFLRSQVKRLTVATIILDVRVTAEAALIRADGWSRETFFERVYPLVTEVSKTRPLSLEECARIFAQAGNSPFAVGRLSCRVEGNLFCPLGSLKDIRRKFFRELHEFHGVKSMEERAARREAIIRSRGDILQRRLTVKPPPNFRYRDSLPNERNYGDLEFDVYPAELDRIPEAKSTARTVLLLPHFVSERMIDSWGKRLRELVRLGYSRFLAPTYGWLSLRDEPEGVEFIAGPYLYAVNPFAVDFLERNGVREFVLSPDIGDDEAGPVAHFEGRLIPRNPPREMFITRLCIPAGAYSMKGSVFRPRHYQEYTVVEDCVTGTISVPSDNRFSNTGK